MSFLCGGIYKHVLKKITRISAVIICKNSEKTLEACLEALRDFEEVCIILDEDSTDNSEYICLSYPNVRVWKHAFLGFGPMKNLACSKAKNDWLFSIDTDEIASPDLLQFLKNAELNESSIYAFQRDNCYQGRVIKACGWDNDYPIRLFNRKKTRFTDAMVHEAIISDGMNLIRRNESIKHLAYHHESELAAKAERYASLYADQHFRKKFIAPYLIPFKTGFTFFKDFVLRRGFLYGSTGWMISRYNALGVKHKYQKLLAKNKNLEISVVVSTYNRTDALTKVLESLNNQSIKPKEILIADDGSDPETGKLISGFEGKIPLLHIWHEDQGFRLSAIRNKAISKVQSPFLAVIDGDMVLHKDFIKDISRHARKDFYLQGKRVLLSEKTTIGFLSGRIKALGPLTPGIVNRLNAISLPLLSGLMSPERKTIKSTRGCSMHFWKEDLIRVNGYNEDIQGWGREDSELALRLLQAGVKRKNMVFSAVAFHLWHREAKRDHLKENDTLLEETERKKLVRCENGLDKYL